MQKAIAFAKKAHHGQLRRTGDPYLVHCIHTGRILAMLVPSSGQRVCIFLIYHPLLLPNQQNPCTAEEQICISLIPSKLKSLLQAVETVVAGILHDVVDDTCESFPHIEEEFGDDVARLVAGVSRLSYINQVLILYTGYVIWFSFLGILPSTDVKR